MAGAGQPEALNLRWLHRNLWMYLVAVASIVVATAVRLLIDPIVGEMHPFVTYIFAIIFCAWYCGLGPAILSMFLGFLAAAYFFANPRGSVAVYGADLQVGLVLYIVLSISSIVFSELMHRANRRAESTAQELMAKQVALEHEVRLRCLAENEKVALLRRVVSLQEEEKLRISRELHDQCGQDLVALQIGIQIAINKSHEGKSTECENVLRESTDTLDKLSRELHSLAFELRPPSLDDLGLRTTIESFLQLWSKRTHIQADFECRNWNKARISRDTSLVLYRVLQESLNNVAKHSNSSHVSVILEMQRDQVVEIIEDRGRGFDSTNESRDRATGRGLGIHGMMERLATVGGSLEIESAQGTGTTVFARVPVQL